MKTENLIRNLRDKYLPFRGTESADMILALCNHCESNFNPPQSEQLSLFNKQKQGRGKCLE